MTRKKKEKNTSELGSDRNHAKNTMKLGKDTEIPISLLPEKEARWHVRVHSILAALKVVVILITSILGLLGGGILVSNSGGASKALEGISKALEGNFSKIDVAQSRKNNEVGL